MHDPMKYALVLAGAVVACGGSEFSSSDGDAALGDDASSMTDASGSPFDSGGSRDGEHVDGTMASDSGAADGGGADGVSMDSSAQDAAAVCPGQCVAPAPSGWTGVEWFAASFGQTAPACSSSYLGRTLGTSGLHVAASTCGCSCGGSTNIVCTLTSDQWCGSSNCIGTISQRQYTSGACTPTAQCGSMMVDFLGPTFSSGTCAKVPTRVLPQPNWDFSTASCVPVTAPTTTGCSTSNVCAPPLDSSFKRCIAQTGDVPSCPIGAYTDGPHVVYSGAATDTRDCAPACDCGPLTGTVACGGTVQFYSDSQCQTTVGSAMPATSACVGPVNAAYGKWTVQPTGGNCAASTNPQPSGAYTPTGPTTFCCLP